MNETQAATSQASSRELLFALLKLDDLVEADRSDAQASPGIPLEPTTAATRTAEKFTRHDLEIHSTPTRRIKVVYTVPDGGAGDGTFPAVLCCHGHGGDRDIVYDPASIYNGFALRLAQRGYATISTDVGQHEVYEAGRTLMGERLWDLMRCVRFLTTRPEVDASRLGCAGLSLGGEMALWLGAMDPRIAAVVSAGFLTRMDNMEQGHCMCWKFPGLRENFRDWSDIYMLIAPRPLQCQKGRKPT